MNGEKLLAVEEMGRKIAYEGKAVRTITVATLYNFLTDLMDYTGYIMADVASDIDCADIAEEASVINHWATVLLNKIDWLGLPDRIPLCELEKDPAGAKFVKDVVKASEDIWMATEELLPGAPIWPPGNSLFEAINSITSCYHVLVEAYLAKKTGSRAVIYDDASPVAKGIARAWDTMTRRNEGGSLYMPEDVISLFGVAYDDIFKARVGGARGHATTVYCKGDTIEYFDTDPHVVLTLYLLLRDSVGCSIRQYDGGRAIYSINTVDERVGEVVSLATSMDYRLNLWTFNAWSMLRTRRVSSHHLWKKALGTRATQKILRDVVKEIPPYAGHAIAGLPIERVWTAVPLVAYRILSKVSENIEVPSEVRAEYEALMRDTAVKLVGRCDGPAVKEVEEDFVEFVKAVVSAEANACWKYLSLFGVSDFWRENY